MSIINHRILKSNTNIDLNFEGGKLSSDSGLLLVKEFVHKTGLGLIIKKMFKTNDTAIMRIHTDFANLMQALYQIIAGYFVDDRADDLTNEPVFMACLEKGALASQPTMSRFYNRMDQDTLFQFGKIQKMMRKAIYSLPGHLPKTMLFDLDTTLLNTYGKQEGSAWNYHYQTEGYHPKVCFNGITGELIRAELRKGTEYCSKDITEFMDPVFKEFTVDYPSVHLFLRGDSGFATPELYEQCETNNCHYTIRLKSNKSLIEKAKEITALLDEKTKKDKVSYACQFGEFQYAASSWSKERRVVCKVEKPSDSFVYQYTFIVTSLSGNPKSIINFYCKRGTMENYIKEGKNGFDFSAVSSSSMIVNSNRLQIHVIAYNIINWMKRYVFPKSMSRDTIETIRIKLFKIASKITFHARKIVYSLCSSYPYKKEFFQILDNISALQPTPYDLLL